MCAVFGRACRPDGHLYDWVAGSARGKKQRRRYFGACERRGPADAAAAAAAVAVASTARDDADGALSSAGSAVAAVRPRSQRAGGA